jgi:hypothetical protein
MRSSASDETIVDEKRDGLVNEIDTLNCPLQSLPLELLLLIFSHLDPLSAQTFSLSSKALHQLSVSISARSALLIRYYGKGACIYSLYTLHKPLLSVDLIQCLITNGGLFPRFLAQILVQDVSISDRLMPASFNQGFQLLLSMYLAPSLHLKIIRKWRNSNQTISEFLKTLFERERCLQKIQRMLFMDWNS